MNLKKKQENLDGQNTKRELIILIGKLHKTLSLHDRKRTES